MSAGTFQNDCSRPLIYHGSLDQLNASGPLEYEVAHPGNFTSHWFRETELDSARYATVKDHLKFHGYDGLVDARNFPVLLSGSSGGDINLRMEGTPVIRKK